MEEKKIADRLIKEKKGEFEQRIKERDDLNKKIEPLLLELKAIDDSIAHIKRDLRFLFMKKLILFPAPKRVIKMREAILELSAKMIDKSKPCEEYVSLVEKKERRIATLKEKLENNCPHTLIVEIRGWTDRSGYDSYYNPGRRKCIICDLKEQDRKVEGQYDKLDDKLISNAIIVKVSAKEYERFRLEVPLDKSREFFLEKI